MKFKIMMKHIYLAALIVTALTAITIAAGGGGGGNGSGKSSGYFSATTVDDSGELYRKGVKANRAGDYKTALKYFHDALKKDGNNPEILNMLAHSQRNLGMLDDAIYNYKKALSIKPDFADAREYLGEAYIQGALQEIAILKSYGSRGENQKKELIEAFKKAAAGIKP